MESRTRSVQSSVSFGSEGIQVMYATVSILAVASLNNTLIRQNISSQRAEIRAERHFRLGNLLENNHEPNNLHF